MTANLPRAANARLNEAGAPSAKREKVDIKSLPDAEKAKIKCKFWNADPAKNRCTGNPCLFKHL